MKRWCVSILIFSLIGCFPSRSALQEEKTDNKDFKVEKLFIVDGCKVYRFTDSMHYRYFTTCEGSVQYQVNQGKTRRPESISTTKRKHNMTQERRQK